MQRFHILLLLLVACFASAVSAQTPAAAPKPDPEFKKFADHRVGHWTYEGEYKPGPLGPGGKVTGTSTYQMILGGFFVERRDTEKDAKGVESQDLALDGYDPVNKNFTTTEFGDDGGIYSGVFTLSGNTGTWSGKSISVAGKQYSFRGTTIYAADWMSSTNKGEVSSDGKTWVPFSEIKYTKVKPAPKK
jgi:hypothetical protein